MAKKKSSKIAAAFQPPAASKAAAITLKAVQQEIAQKNLGWEAGRTALSDAPLAELSGRFGLAIQPDVLAATASKVRSDEQFWGLMGAFAPPAATDWRNRDGGDYVKNARDQTPSCQSCVAFAVVGAIEACVRIACKNPSYDIALSETDLFACGCGPCCARGWYPREALMHCKSVGVATASQVPYRPFDVACTTAPNSGMRIADFAELTTRPSIKQAVYSQGPCVYGMMVYSDFRYYRGGVYRHAAGGRLGLHAILIVGYDDAQQCWICKNSWGTSWGENGFFRIYYDDVSFFGPGYSFQAFSVTVPCPGGGSGTTACAQYVPMLKDVIRAGWADANLKAYLRYWVCGLGQQPAANAQFATLANQIRSVMQACPSYLTWFCDNLLRQ